MDDDFSDEDARTRDLLRATGSFEDAPRMDLARDAVARLRGRRRAVNNVNELMRIFQHLLRGLSSILGSTPQTDEEKRRG